MLRIGTAGWTITPAGRDRVPGPGTHLERYARALPCVEINSSFHRPHRISTWQKWAAATPDTFRFSVKLPKAITHTARLVVAPEAFRAFVDETSALGPKLAVVLVQLPPSLQFNDCPAPEFFESIRDAVSVPIALEPRHPSWFSSAADDLLHSHAISRVAADPVRDPARRADALPEPGGSSRLRYFRLHGSPRTYYSSYAPSYLQALSDQIRTTSEEQETWVIFDNTASGEALANALDLQQLCRSPHQPPPAKKLRAQPKPRPSVQTDSLAKPKNSSRTRSSSSSSD